MFQEEQDVVRKSRFEELGMWEFTEKSMFRGCHQKYLFLIKHICPSENPAKHKGDSTHIHVSR